MVTLEARGMIFFLLKCGKTIYAQVTYAEIAFIYTFSGNNNSGKWKIYFPPLGENAFSPKGINGISDRLGRNFFADWSAKQFLPTGNIISENQLTNSADFSGNIVSGNGYQKIYPYFRK